MTNSAAAQPLVTVVIPTYNRARLLGEAIDSVLAQQWSSLQTVVADDGSTDSTPELVSRYGDRVEYFHQPNAGQAAARNRGVERARGEFIAFLDSDDLWLPHKIRTEMDVFARLPEAAAVFSNSEHWQGDTLVLPSRFAKTGVRTPHGEPDYLPPRPPIWIEMSLVSTCCMTLRRKALEILGRAPFDESRTVNEDWELEMRLLHYCRVAICPSITARVRRFEDDTRKGRAMPGVPLTPAQRHRLLMRHRNLLDRALLLPGLASDIAAAVRAKRSALTAELETLAVREVAVQ
jgi:glycosyltransferase involved in cell wall biosynthesis